MINLLKLLVNRNSQTIGNGAHLCLEFFGSVLVGVAQQLVFLEDEVFDTPFQSEI